MLDHFEGDIGSIVLVKKSMEQAKVIPAVKKCKKTCQEYIEMNMVGNENLLVSLYVYSLLFKKIVFSTIENIVYRKN